MKSLLIFIVSSFILLGNLKSQNLPIAKKLDEKNGFKDFSIGDNFSKWESNLTFTNQNGENKFYTYNGSCCQQLFNTNLQSIRLGFKDNLLVVIYLETTTEKNENGGWMNSSYGLIKSNFETLFDVKSPDLPGKDSNGEVSSFWKGEKLFLSLTYEYMGVKKFGESYSGTGRCKVMIGLNVSLDDGF